MSPYEDDQIHRMMVEQGHTPSVAPKAKRKRDNEESRNQIAFVKWWDGFGHKKYGVPALCLMAIPNAGWRTPAVAAIMKAEGLRTGAPDLLLATARWNSATGSMTCGLFIEFKTPKAVVPPAQVAYHELLRTQGYRVVVVRSALDAIELVKNYLRA